MVRKVRETREYEADSHDNRNRPTQPLGHRLVVWARPTYEARIKFTCRKPKHNGHQSHNDLKNSSSQSLVFPLWVRPSRQPNVNLSRFLDCAWFVRLPDTCPVSQALGGRTV
jgi:hypothetical protein